MEVFSQALRHSPGEGTDVIPADARADCFRMKYTTPPGEKTIQFPPLFRGRGPTGFARFWIVFLKKHMKSVHRLPVRQRMRTGKQIMAELREKRGEITSVDQTYIVFSRM